MLRLRLNHPAQAVSEDGKYLPGRGLLYSLLVHEIAFFAVSILSVTGPSTVSRPQDELVTIIELKDLEALYLPLPVLGAGDRPRREPESPSAPKPSKGNGLSYPGPQPIHSDFPNATNRIQTLLQPSLSDPVILRPPLTLPNIVQMAEYTPPPLPAPPEQHAAQFPLIRFAPAASPDQPKAALPARIPQVEIPEARRPEAPQQQPAQFPSIRFTQPVTLDRPAVTLPTQLPQAAIPEAKRPEAPQQLPAQFPSIRDTQPAALDQPRATLPPRIPQAAIPPAKPPEPPAKPVEPLLALSPIPAPRDEIVRVPLGEARGRFDVSPQPNLAGDESKPGGKSENQPSGNRANGDPAADSTKDKPAPIPTPNPGPSAGAPGARNEFPGITILGAGALIENGNPVAPTATKNPAPLQTSYSLTILSTEASGGGLPQFGVFSKDEQIHTVYLDMRRSMFDTTPSWTFQYALLKPSAEPATSSRSRQGLVLPFPMVKEHPSLPIDVLRKHLNKMVIVYAVINLEGKMDQLEVKETPDPSLSGPVLAALRKWSFRPAELEGQKVPVKVLLGIPLALP